MAIAFVCGYLLWSSLLVWLYIWAGEARFWRRYDRERRTFTNDHTYLMTALQQAVRKEPHR